MGKSQKDQPDAGLKSLDHCTRLVFLLSTRGLSQCLLTAARSRHHRFAPIAALALLATTEAHPTDPI
jgi:hypothetical protein